jgi:hypothetical protein
MTKLLSDRIRKTPSTEADPERYEFISLSNAEPDLGVPQSDNQTLYSLLDGTRYWGNPVGFTGSTGYDGSQGYTGSNAEIESDDSIDGVGTVASPLSVVKFASPVDISLSGEVSGTVSFDGSQNVDIVTSVNSITTITKTLTITQDWQDLGINGTDLENGTYAIQLYANDVTSGGESIKEYHSGIMSWFSEPITQSIVLPNDEIILHRAGGGGTGIIYLRTFRSDINDILKLQISASYIASGSSNYVIKLRKII